MRCSLRSFIATWLAAFVMVAPFGEARAATPIMFAFSHRIDGAAAPFVAANARGFFRAEDVGVRFDQAKGSEDAIRRVSSGERDMALVDLTALIRYREQADVAPVKAIFMLYNQTPYAVVARRSRGIAALGDLQGKTLGIAEGDMAAAQWPAFARHNAIDPAKVPTQKISAAVREPMLSAGQLDAITSFSFSTAVDIKDRGIPASDLIVFRFADYGSTLYGHAIIVNPDFARTHAASVAGFLRGLVTGIKFTLKDPAKAIDDVLAQNEGASRELELERLRTVIRDNIVTEEVKRIGLGAIDPQRLDRSVEEIRPLSQMHRITAADIFDDSFLPPLAVRMLQPAAGR